MSKSSGRAEAICLAEPAGARGASLGQIIAEGTVIRLPAGRAPTAVEDRSLSVIGESELVLRAEALAEARRMTDGISGVLALLRNFDRLVPGEPELVRLEEIAALFADIGDFATYGSQRVRYAADAIRDAARAQPA
jgi:hypothetical protein